MTQSLFQRQSATATIALAAAAWWFLLLSLAIPVDSIVVGSDARLAAAAPSPEAFVQFNATLFLYADQAPIATWASLPFESGVQQVVWVGGLGVFLVTFQDFARTPVFVSVVPHTNATQLQIIPWNGLGGTYGPVSVAGSSIYSVYVDPLSGFVFVQCSTTGFRENPAATNCSSVSVPLASVGASDNVTVVNDVFATDFGLVIVGTNAGLVVANVSATTTVTGRAVRLSNTSGDMRIDSDVHRVFYFPDDGFVYAATKEPLVTSNAWTTDLVHQVSVATSEEFYFMRTPAPLDAIPNAFVHDRLRGAVHLANANCDSVYYTNGTIERLAGLNEGGLPQANLTCGAAHTPPSGTVWMGSKFGVVVLQPDGSWKYLFGPRWLPGSGFQTGMYVSSLDVGVASQDGGSDEEYALIATDTGMSLVRRFWWASLDAKAAMYEAQLPQFYRYGLTSQLQLPSFGNTSGQMQTPTANDGLWSSLVLGAHIFRFAATGDESARADAWSVFRGMTTLINVTGDPGYPARNFVYSPITNCSAANQYYRSPTMPDFCWNGDTSSDEITGHLHIYPLMNLLVAQTVEEKASVQAVIDNILLGIIRNNLTLVDPATHKETTWGRWQPSQVNDRANWYDDRGVNSNEILTFLVLAYAISGNPAYADTFYTLVDEYHYDINIIDLKVEQPSDINHSDDELTFLPYLAYLFGARFANGTKNPLFERLAPQMWLSIQRTHAFVASEKPSLYNAVYAAAAVAIGGLTEADSSVRRAVEDSLWWFHTYPLSYVDWPIDNRNRRDIEFITTQVDRNSLPDLHHTYTIFPYDELSMSRWNSNPFTTTQGSGYCGLDPSPFLYPFWFGRYMRLW